MADDSRKSTEIPENGQDSPKEDAETKATREELKQTVISDTKGTSTPTNDPEVDKKESAAATAPARATTPTQNSTEASDALKEQISSPKKKRAHDELDENKDILEPVSLGSTAQDTDSSSAVSRIHRSEPEKKRPRDEPGSKSEKTMKVDLHDAHPELDSSNGVKGGADTTESKSVQAGTTEKTEKATTSSSAFASSGFAKLTGTASPFGSLGATGSKLGGFGGASPWASSSPAGALAPGPKLTTPTLSFDKDAKPAAASPFASLNGGPSKPFGSVFGGGVGSGFGGGFGGSKLSSFAKPGGDLKKSEKPAKPFGAPENEDSDGDDDDGDDDEADTGADEPEDDDNDKEPEETATSGSSDDKKKKLQKVAVDDGESGEVSVFTARAKVYQLDKTSQTWKERGGGILKINVPQDTIQLDDNGVPLLDSFDASTLDDKVVRLIMRQDSTHRVVLNTAVLISTEFKERESYKNKVYIFSSLEVEGSETKPVTLQLKMSQSNGDAFVAKIKNIQKEMKAMA